MNPQDLDLLIDKNKVEYLHRYFNDNCYFCDKPTDMYLTSSSRKKICYWCQQKLDTLKTKIPCTHGLYSCNDYKNFWAVLLKLQTED